MRIRYLIALGVALVAAPAAAESWFYLEGDDTSVDYVDADTVYSNGSTSSAQVFRGLGGEDSKEASYAKLGIEVSCASSQFRIVSATYYDAARQYLSADSTASAWLAFGEDTLPPKVQYFVCSGIYRDDLVANPFDDADEYWDWYWSEDY